MISDHLLLSTCDISAAHHAAPRLGPPPPSDAHLRKKSGTVVAHEVCLLHANGLLDDVLFCTGSRRLIEGTRYRAPCIVSPT